MLFDDKSVGAFHSDKVGVKPTHWAPIAKAPPLPKPVEKTQEEKDREWAKQLQDNWQADIPFMPHCFGEHCIRYGRADGRRQLAVECLALINGDGGFMTTGGKLRLLHELLTEAAR